MNKLSIFGCLSLLAACSAGSGNAKPDSTKPDSVVAPAPAPMPVAAPAPVSTPAPARTTTAPVTGSGAAVPPPKVIPPAAQPAVGDTARGIVSVVGAEFDRRVTVASPGGERTRITGSMAPMIGHLSGADVWVSGKMAGTSLEASSFVVRTVDGAPAIDGILRTEGTMLYIVTSSGTRTHIVTPPPPLVGRDGARVWITGDPAHAVASFGFIDPQR